MNDRLQLFEVGHVTCTPLARHALADARVSLAEVVCRHQLGQPGDPIPTRDEPYRQALRQQGRFVSAYRIAPDCILWAVTEPDRSATTMILPHEYGLLGAAAYELRFRSLFNCGRGLSFPCDFKGQVDLDSLSEQARRNYLCARVLAGREYELPVVLPLAGKTVVASPARHLAPNVPGE